jgi:hypothetical protein
MKSQKARPWIKPQFLSHDMQLNDVSFELSAYLRTHEVRENLKSHTDLTFHACVKAPPPIKRLLLAHFDIWLIQWIVEELLIDREISKSPVIKPEAYQLKEALCPLQHWHVPPRCHVNAECRRQQLRCLPFAFGGWPSLNVL